MELLLLSYLFTFQESCENRRFTKGTKQCTVSSGVPSEEQLELDCVKKLASLESDHVHY